MANLPIDPEAIQAIQAKWQADQKAVIQKFASFNPEPLADRRFQGKAWQSDRFASCIAASYIVNCQAMMGLVDALKVDERQRQKVRFAVQQYLETMAPSNFFAMNPEAINRFKETKGQSLIQGLKNLLSDVGKGHLSITDESAFEVGRNVGTSPGAVVFENELVQVLQYHPTTPKVFSKPILLVPPCINKFYILDLQPENSLVKFLVDQGHQVFLVSWRNVGAEQGHCTWDDYLQLGVVDSIAAVQAVSKQATLNMLGFCVGGTILSTALAALEAQGENPCESLTLLTTFLDFSSTGTLGLMVDENFVAYREQTLNSGGLMRGQELATTFSFLRPNDLVWNYFVSNYLKGEAPPPFDLLYWNSDSTNLAGPMYAWYLRNTYLENNLREPGRVESLGVPVDLSALTMPAYILNTREDHIVPWQGGYQSTNILGGPCRFVLGASGHIAGVVNPASKNKRSYWVGDSSTGSSNPYPVEPETWLAHATEMPGSWWNDWSAWLKQYAGPLKTAPKSLGSAKFKPIEPAPGRYVKQPAP